MPLLTEHAGAHPAVIPAKAGIHRCSRHTYGGAPDTSNAGVLAVICAKTGMPLLTEHAGTLPAVIPAKAGIH